MRRSSILVAALCSGLAACTTTTAAPAVTLTVGAAHNAADVTFVETLIPHHRAGIALASQAASHPATHILAEAIITTQQDEVTRMTGWLTTWGVQFSAPPPSTTPTGDPVRALAAHQDEAVTLAQREQAQGSNPAVLAFAQQIIESRTAEAAQLRSERPESGRSA